MWKWAGGVLCVLTLAACSSSSAKASPTATSSKSPSTTVATSSFDPCALLTAHDASVLLGKTVTRQPTDSSAAGACTYGPSPNSETNVQIAVKSDPDDAYAQADYPTWVQSVLNAPGYALVPVSNFADGATLVHTSVFDAILFRHGSELVKIGASPKASDAALKRAATTVLSRL